jgi:hypothetical protein
MLKILYNIFLKEKYFVKENKKYFKKCFFDMEPFWNKTIQHWNAELALILQ